MEQPDIFDKGKRGKRRGRNAPAPKLAPVPKVSKRQPPVRDDEGATISTSESVSSASSDIAEPRLTKMIQPRPKKIAKPQLAKSLAPGGEGEGAVPPPGVFDDLMAAFAGGASTEEWLRERPARRRGVAAEMLLVYRAHNPAKEAELPMLLEKYRGREEGLIEARQRESQWQRAFR